jgi:hypothetical protein
MATSARASASTTSRAATSRKKQRSDTTATKHQASVAANGVAAAGGPDCADELTALYPPGQSLQETRRGYIDDTLALPPHHLLHGTPPPEALAAARAKAIVRALIPPAGPRAKRARSGRAQRAAEASAPPTR